jgi:hypothetical protein
LGFIMVFRLLFCCLDIEATIFSHHVFVELPSNKISFS